MKPQDMPEPPNNTLLVVIDIEGTPIAIWRDDDHAATDSQTTHEDQRWFGLGDTPAWEFPDTWQDVISDASAIYVVPSYPIAREGA